MRFAYAAIKCLIKSNHLTPEGNEEQMSDKAIEKVAYGEAVQADVEDFWKVGQVLGHVTQKVKDLFAKKADMVAFDEKRIKCLVANPSLYK